MMMMMMMMMMRRRTRDDRAGQLMIHSRTMQCPLEENLRRSRTMARVGYQSLNMTTCHRLNHQMG
jgi:hypothetical protein